MALSMVFTLIVEIDRRCMRTDHTKYYVDVVVQVKSFLLSESPFPMVASQSSEPPGPFTTAEIILLPDWVSRVTDPDRAVLDIDSGGDC
jgi:hypothetical protein